MSAHVATVRARATVVRLRRHVRDALGVRRLLPRAHKAHVDHARRSALDAFGERPRVGKGHPVTAHARGKQRRLRLDAVAHDKRRPTGNVLQPLVQSVRVRGRCAIVVTTTAAAAVRIVVAAPVAAAPLPILRRLAVRKVIVLLVVARRQPIAVRSVLVRVAVRAVAHAARRGRRGRSWPDGLAPPGSTPSSGCPIAAPDQWPAAPRARGPPPPAADRPRPLVAGESGRLRASGSRGRVCARSF